MFRYSRRRAQSTLEYAVLIGIVAAGLIAMQAYVKRGFQGRMSDSTDKIGSQFDPKSSFSNTLTTSTQNDVQTITGTALQSTSTTAFNSYSNETTNISD